MRLCSLADFDDRHWQRAFQAFVKANHSHWTGPPFDFVKGMLEKRGWYEFHVPAMGTWTCRFRLEAQDGHVEAIFVKNDALTGRMRDHLDAMERAFAHTIDPR